MATKASPKLRTCRSVSQRGCLWAVLGAVLRRQGRSLPGGEQLSITPGSVEGLNCPQPPACLSSCSQKGPGEGRGGGAAALTHL